MTLGTLNKRMMKSRERNGQQEDFRKFKTGLISIAWQKSRLDSVVLLIKGS